MCYVMNMNIWYDTTNLKITSLENEGVEQVQDDLPAVDVVAGDVADEPVPELCERPVLAVVDVQVGEDDGVHGAALEGPLQVGGEPAFGL